MNLFSDIWKSFLVLPAWVKIWVFLILLPVNIVSIWFLGNPGANLVASFAIAGLVFNAIPMWFDRGFSSAMAIPHVIFWVPLALIITYYLLVSATFLADNYRLFLITLLVCNVISLSFDIPDSFKWIRDQTKIR